MANKIRWPAWVWYENVVATEKALEKLLNAFGSLACCQLFDGTFVRRRRVVTALEDAMEDVRGVSPAWGDSIYGLWRSSSTSDRRRVWRMAMKTLGYTEVCDA